MKILVFTTLFPNSKMPNYAVFVKERVKSLAKVCDVRVMAPVPYFPKLNINKKWFAFSQIPPEEEIDGIKVYHPRYFITPKFFRSLYGLFIFLGALGFVRHLRKEFDFDLIDSHFVYPDGLAAVLLAKVLGKEVIVTARGTDINWYPGFKIIRKQIQYCLGKADAVVAVSNDLRDKMVALGVMPDLIKVIPNGVDNSIFYPLPKAAARNELGIGPDKKVLLSVGNLLEAKGFHFLIKAVSFIQQNDVELLIIGEGSYRRSLEELISKLNLNDKITLLGERPHKDIAKWYSAADLFCLTSLREGRPNVILESIACGTPVVTMDRWGLPEIVTQGSGILIDSYEPDVIAETIEHALCKEWDRSVVAGSVNGMGWEKTSKDLTELFNKILNKQDIIFFSSDDWNSGLKTSKYHLATRLARDNRVFFINSLGLRTPSASARDAKRIFAKLAGFFKGVTRVRENLFVYTPIAIPFQGIGFARWINNIILSLQVRRVMAKFRVHNPVVWTFLPNSLGVVRRLPKRSLIYYCVDDMSAFKGVPKEIITKLDEALAKEANVVFAVSRELFDKKRLFNKNTFYSPHGVDFDLFNKAVTERTPEKVLEIADIPKPIIGFYGLVSSDWIDYDLVRFIAAKRPEWSFVFIGKVDKLNDAPPEAKNIYYLSVKPYEELYKYSRFFDVAILPFNVNKLTMNSHPLKILEYLSAGKPIVSVKIPELAKYEGVVEAVSDRDDFLNKIELCLNDRDDAQRKRIEFAAQHSWENRFNEIQDIIAYHS